MFKIADDSFDINSYDGRVNVSETKISVSGKVLAIKKEGIRPYWKASKLNGVVSLDEDTVKSLNSLEMFNNSELTKVKCMSVLSKRIFDQIEKPFLNYLSEQTKLIRDIPATDKEALSLSESLKMEVISFIDNPAISKATRDALSKLLNKFLNYVPDAIELKKRCSLDILKAVMEHRESSGDSLTIEQKNSLESFINKYKGQLKLGFFLDNLDNIKYPASDRKKIIEVVLGQRLGPIEDSLFYIFS